MLAFSQVLKRVIPQEWNAFSVSKDKVAMISIFLLVLDVWIVELGIGMTVNWWHLITVLL